MIMRKNILRIITVILACFTLGATVGCKNETSGNEKGKQSVSQMVTGLAKDSKTGEALYFIKNRTSNYKIVLPTNPSQEEIYASQFLYDTVRSATGTKLSIVNESSSLNTEDYYIVLGRTKLAQDNKLCKSESELNVNGFSIALVDNTVVICGASEVGTVYGCQEFLSYAINYKVYAIDEIYYDKVSTVRMPNFGELHVKPSFAYYGPGTYQAKSVEEAILFRSSSRLDVWDNLSGSIWDSKFIDHSVKDIALKSEHPDWYTGSQICYSKPEAQDFLAEKLVERMEINPDSVFLYQLGNADDPSACTCSSCVQMAVTYGTAGGAYVVWLNRIAEKAERLMEERGIEKEKWYLVGLMYNAFESAPVVYDKKTNTYKPINDEVICGEHVGVQYCPIRACHAHPFDSDDCKWNVEAQTKKDLYGWSILTDFYCNWTYNTEFYNFLFLFDDFGSLAQNIRASSEIGLDFYIYQRTNNTCGVFDKLRTYIITQLGWNCYLDYENLVDDFFENYYKEAAPYMKEYYNAIRAQIHVIGKKFGYEGCLAYNMSAGNYFASSNWSFGLLQSYEEILKKAYTAIENAGYDEEKAEELRLRIRVEEMFCSNYFVRNYQSYFTETEYTKLCDDYYRDCKILGYSQTAEGAYINK